MPSPQQLLIVAFIVLLLFGASRLGDIGKGLGEGIKNFKKGIDEGDDADDSKKSKKKLEEASEAADEPDEK